MTNDEIILEILAAEGGLQNDPADRDGPLSTKFGITARTLEKWRGTPITEDDMKSLDDAEAKEIYLQLFIRGPHYDRIEDHRLRYQLVDFGITSGPFIATSTLQRILGVRPDGVLGPETLVALARRDPREVHTALVAARVEQLGKLVQREPSQLRFLVGWLKRALKFLRLA